MCGVTGGLRGGRRLHPLSQAPPNPRKGSLTRVSGSNLGRGGNRSQPWSRLKRHARSCRWTKSLWEARASAPFSARQNWPQPAALVQKPLFRQEPSKHMDRVIEDGYTRRPALDLGPHVRAHQMEPPVEQLEVLHAHIPRATNAHRTLITLSQQSASDNMDGLQNCTSARKVTSRSGLSAAGTLGYLWAEHAALRGWGGSGDASRRREGDGTAPVTEVALNAAYQPQTVRGPNRTRRSLPQSRAWPDPAIARQPC